MSDSAFAPVEMIETGSRHREPEEGIALCLSGGGYRAMLFHVGALWRLNEAGYLPRLARISSVSGGSITAAVLGMHWNILDFDEEHIARRFVELVVTPIRRLAGKTIDIGSIIRGVFLSGTVSDWLTRAYKQHLFGEKTLQDLPKDPPRFVLNATNVQSGALWRFMKPYMCDWRVGKIEKPEMSLAVAVAASSAFPPVLSPAILKLRTEDFTANSGCDLQRPPYTTRVVLSDGGVYDNLGLETAWKRYQTILVSDAGGKLSSEGEPKTNWICHVLRILHVVDNQVRSLRKRQLIQSYQLSGSYEAGRRNGTYWGIRTNIANYKLEGTLPCPLDRTTALAETPTRLKRLPAERQERLINWGYAVSDAALRKYVDRSLATPTDFPYPAAGV